MPWLPVHPTSRRPRALPGILAILFLALLLPAAVSSAPLTSVFVNGVRIDTYPETRNGVSYLPIHAMAQALQVEISWDSKINLVKVNGEAVEATAYNLDGKIYLPIESFVSALGGSVTYDGRENAVRVTTGGLSNLAARSSGTTSPAATRPTPKASPTPTSAPRPRTTVALPSTPRTPTVVIPSTVSAYTPPATTAAPPSTASSTSYTPAANASYGNSGGYTSNTTAAGYPAPYAPNPQMPSAQPRPTDAPPYLSDNLQTGPAMRTTGGPQDNVPFSPMPANAQRPGDGIYVPRSAQNSVFQVTVTNLENVTVIKDFYRPRTGYKFVVVYLSQQNISEQVQIYTGRFSLLDQKNASYDYIEGLSNFWLVILRPFGINFGYLVFEVPTDAKPISLVLHALNQAPLTLNL
jgi:hypothetical protein